MQDFWVYLIPLVFIVPGYYLMLSRRDQRSGALALFIWFGLYVVIAVQLLSDWLERSYSVELVAGLGLILTVVSIGVAGHYFKKVMDANYQGAWSWPAFIKMLAAAGVAIGLFAFIIAIA